MILDHEQITITYGLIAKLLANNVPVITCNSTYHPTGMLLNLDLDGHTLQSQRFRVQIEAPISHPQKATLAADGNRKEREKQAALVCRESTE